MATAVVVLILALSLVRRSAAADPVTSPPIVAARDDAPNVADAEPVSAALVTAAEVEHISAAPANCSMNAAATPPDDHGQPADFGPSQATPRGPAPSAYEAIGFARRVAGMFGQTSAAPATSQVAAQKMAFFEFGALAGWPKNPTINPQRCVWVVTVHAPMAVKVPPGVSPRTVDVYSVVIDAASGTMIGVLTGSDLVR